jgi:hypothetical protein
MKLLGIISVGFDVTDQQEIVKMAVQGLDESRPALLNTNTRSFV